MAVMTALFIALMAAGFVLAIRAGERTYVVTTDPSQRDHQLLVARRRLIAGEIDAEQYERIVRALGR
jgi:uncharacterized membrane protein